MKLSLVVPCYNEEANVKRFFDEVNKVFRNNVPDFEFVFVNENDEFLWTYYLPFLPEELPEELRSQIE